MNNKNSLQFIFLFSIFLIIAAWGLSWIINSRTDYYKILDTKAKELIILKKDDFLTNIALSQKNLLYKEKEYLEKTFPYVKEINFFISETKEFITKEFKITNSEITIKESLILEKVYPIFLNEIFIGDIQIILEDKKLKDSLYISTLFLLVICFSFIGLGYHIIRNFNLESVIKEKKSELNKNISYIMHELKNPITAINNIAYLLKSNCEDKTLIDRIKSLSEDIQEKISYIINITKVDFNIMREKTSLINLHTFVSEIIEKLSYIKVNQPIEIENKIEDNIDLTLPVDILEIILDNIISNAIKYTNEGKITIEATPIDKDLNIIITDTGIGIPPEDKEKVFEIFYRSSNLKGKNIKGTGVGLALVKKAIDHLKWKISIESPVYKNRGTRVIITIPSYARFLN